MDQLGKADLELGTKTNEKIIESEEDVVASPRGTEEAKVAEKLPAVSYWELYRSVETLKAA